MSTENVKILLRRGFRDEITSATLETGEMGFTTDTNQLFVGIDDAIDEIQFDPFANAHAVIQSWLDSVDNPEPGLTIDEDLVIRNVTDVDGLMDAMNFFAQTITFDTITQTFTPGDTLNQKYNKNLDGTFETRTTAEIVSASVGTSSTVVTLKINGTQPSLRKEEDFSVVLTNQNTGGNTLGGITVTDAKLKDRWHSPISVDVDNGVDAVYQLTLANNDYLYSFNETTKEGTINFTTPISDGQTTTEQVDTTETITADGSETQFNLLNFPDPAPSSIELSDANGTVFVSPTDYEIYDQNHPNYNGTVEEIKFVTAPTIDVIVSYKKNVTDDQNDLIESLTVNFSDDANFYFETVDTTNTITDLSSIAVSNITGGSVMVSQYGRPRQHVEVITENSFNQLFTDQHLSSLDLVTGLRPSLFRKTFEDASGVFLKYHRDVCTSFFIDYSLKQYDDNATYVRVGQLKIINGYPLGITALPNPTKLTDDNTEIWQDNSNGIAEVDEFSNIEFFTNINGDNLEINFTQNVNFTTEISYTVKRWSM